MNWEEVFLLREIHVHVHDIVWLRLFEPGLLFLCVQMIIATTDEIAAPNKVDRITTVIAFRSIPEMQGL